MHWHRFASYECLACSCVGVWAVWCSLRVVDRAFGQWPEHRLLFLRCSVGSLLHPGRYLCCTSSRLRPVPSQCCPFHCSPAILPKKAMVDWHSVVQKMGRGVPVVARKAEHDFGPSDVSHELNSFYYVVTFFHLIPLLPTTVCRCTGWFLHLITLRHTILGWTPLDEGSVLRRDHSLSTWQPTALTRDKHPCPPTGFELTVPASEMP